MPMCGAVLECLSALGRFFMAQMLCELSFGGLHGVLKALKSSWF